MLPLYAISWRTNAKRVRYVTPSIRQYAQRLLMLTAVSVTYALPAAQASVGENLLTKASYNASTCGLSNFEPTLSACAQPVVPWNQIQWGNNTSQFAIVQDFTQKNAAMLTVSNFVDGAAYWGHAPVNVKPSTMYRYRAKIKTNSTTSAWAEVEFQLSNGNYRYLPLSRVGANTSWATFTDDFYTPSDAISATVYVFMRSNGSVTIDDVAMIELAPPAERSSDAYLNYALKRPLVSIVFDDGTGDIWNNAIPLLDTKGYKTTQFVVGRLIGTSGYMTSNQLVELSNAGHELASHTWTHRSLITLNSTELHNETVTAQSNLRSMLPSCVLSNRAGEERCFDQFAYPFGDMNQTVLNKVRSTYRSARGTEDGLNTLLVKHTGTTSPESMHIRHRIHTQIVLNPTAGGGGVTELQGWLNGAKRSRTWLVLLYHRVKSQPDAYGLTPTQFSGHLNAIEASGICVTPMHKALNEIQLQNTYQAVCGKPGLNSAGNDSVNDSRSPAAISSSLATEPTAEQISELTHGTHSDGESKPSMWRQEYKQSRFASK